MNVTHVHHQSNVAHSTTNI